MKARLNDCGVCYGGATGLPTTAGMNACEQCQDDPEADEASCMGCDGVPNRYVAVDVSLLLDGRLSRRVCFGSKPTTSLIG